MAEERLYGDAFKDVKFPDFGEFFKRVGSAYVTAANPYGSAVLGPRPTGDTPPVSGMGMTDAQRNAMIGDKKRDYGVTPEPEATPGGTGGGMGRNPINALFAPMFQDLKRQRQLANQRYEANKDQVTNIYGQITGARSADKAASETAFQRWLSRPTL
jgi:hypothetical protein